LANLSTEESQAQRILKSLSTSNQLAEFLKSLMSAISRRSVEKSEEFILNAISCTTNMLFYDTNQTNILQDEVRGVIFETLKPHLLSTQNEEIQIESVRVISNLSRHGYLCNQFLEDSDFL
jgi:hypothetical protein